VEPAVGSHPLAAIASSAASVHHRLELRRASILGLIAAAVVLTACGGDHGASRATDSTADEAEPTPNPKHLIVQPSDLPFRFSPVPGERIPVPLASVLADPWSARGTDVIRRERVAGYEASFWSPQRQRIECAAAVYRSRTGAREVFRLRSKRFEAFLAASKSGHPTSVERIGDETHAYRFELGRSKALTLTWRYRNVLASCGTMGVRPADMQPILLLAVAQQARMAQALG
jgi:hypothetical protein